MVFMELIWEGTSSFTSDWPLAKNQTQPFVLSNGDPTGQSWS